MQLAEGMRLGMRRLASGVCVMASQKQGDRYAMTASSVTSLSDSPASLLICVNKSAAIQSILTKSHPFTINILSRDQQEVSNKCAERNAGDERFSVGAWTVHDGTGLPYLADSQAIFFCEVDNDSYLYGTHQIVIGRITEVVIPDVSIDPLIYMNGGYQQLEP